MVIKVKKSAVKKFRRGYPLIQEEDLQSVPETNQWVEFCDQEGKYLATGYLGEQNKGIGWLVSWQRQPIDQAFFTTCFQIAKEKRSSYYNDAQTTAFRIFNGEGDGVGGMTVDLYDEYAVFSWYNATLYHRKEVVLAAFQTVFPEVKGAYEKIRFQAQGLPESQQVYGESAPEPLLVLENGVHYAVYLNEGLMTGIFLDQKEVRGRLAGGLAQGKRVLNMFSYTGAFSVAAAMGGALETTSVDLAKRSLPKTREQFAVNGLDPETQKIHVMDVFNYFDYGKKKGLLFDLIVLDPPSFARNKKRVFSVHKNYGDLITDSLPILAPGGLILASTNAANLPAERFQKTIEEAFETAGVQYHLQEAFRLPGDFVVNPAFSEGNYLKVFLYQVKQ